MSMRNNESACGLHFLSDRHVVAARSSQGNCHSGVEQCRDGWSAEGAQGIRFVPVALNAGYKRHSTKDQE